MSAFFTVKIGNRGGWQQACYRLFYPIFAVVFCSIVICKVMCPDLAYAKSAPAYQIKAGFIYRFLSFIDFPKKSEQGVDNDFFIGVMGDHTVLNELRIAKGNRIRGKTVVVQAVDADASTAVISKYHVMFIGKSLESQMREILSRMQTIPMLTISDDASFIEKGGIIQFVESEGKIRFIINLPAAETNHLVIHSRLKRVALQLTGDTE